MRRAVALAGALLLACGPSAAPAVSPTPTPVAESTPAPATTAPTSRPSPTSNPTRVDVVLRFAPGTNISDIDDVYDMITHLRSTPGIHDGFGDENQITVVYDPRQVTVEKIRQLLEEMGYPTLPPA